MKIALCCWVSEKLMVMFVFGAKETTIVLPFIFLSWFVISWLYAKKQ
jgi:hypothetical protein